MADSSDENNPTEAIPVAQNPDVDESSSSYEDEDAESTASVTESIMQYRELHGRTFENFRTTEYWGPNDEKQNTQLDIGHHMLTLILDGKLFIAPIPPNPQKVIDVGTGTGIWAIDFADAHPSAEVIGTDLSPIQPSFVPPNCKFELDDAQLEWTYPRAAFDYVHIRCLMGSISDWPSLYTQAFQCIKPGGWIEQMEFSIEFNCDDGSFDKNHVLSRWGDLVHQAGEVTGRTFKICDLAKQYIIDAGFTDVTETKYKLPIGPWDPDPKSKLLGSWSLLYLLQGLEGMMLYLLSSVLKWEYIEIQAYLGQVRSALKDRRIHSYTVTSVVYGKKPDK